MRRFMRFDSGRESGRDERTYDRDRRRPRSGPEGAMPEAAIADLLAAVDSLEPVRLAREVLSGSPSLSGCSHCGRSDVWSEGWSYHGNVECSTCWTAVIDAVACSDVCAKALQALERLTPEARAEVIEAAKRRDQP